MANQLPFTCLQGFVTGRSGRTNCRYRTREKGPPPIPSCPTPLHPNINKATNLSSLVCTIHVALLNLQSPINHPFIHATTRPRVLARISTTHLPSSTLTSKWMRTCVFVAAECGRSSAEKKYPCIHQKHMLRYWLACHSCIVLHCLLACNSCSVRHYMPLSMD